MTLNWWLIRVTLVVAFGFLPQQFGRWWGPTNSLNAGSEVGIPWGGGDIQTLPYAKNLFELFTLTGSRATRTSGTSTHAIVHAQETW